MILVVRCLKNLINFYRSWFSWSRRILDPSNFRNKSSLYRNRFLFELHQKKKHACAWIKNRNLFWPWAVYMQVMPFDSPLSTCHDACRKSETGSFSVSCCRHVDNALCAVDIPIDYHTFCLICFFSQVFFFSNFNWIFLTIISYLKTR